MGDCSVGGLNRAVVWNEGVPSLLPLPPVGYDRSQAIGINEAGAIAGICTETGTLRNNACLWANGSVQTLQTPAGVASSAHGINESGVVVGNVGGFATVWTAGVPQTIPSVDPASAFAINDLGEVPVLTGNGSAVWNVAAGSVTPVVSPVGATGAVVATGINNEGHLSGWAEFPSGLLPFRWIDGVPEPLEIPAAGTPNSAGLGINGDDNVAGYVRSTTGQMRAAVWRDGELTLVGAHSSFAYTINGLGVAAGAQGFVAHLFVPADQVALQMVDLVEELVESGDLNAHDAHPLQSQLEAAAARLAADDTAAALRILRAFNSRIAALVRSGRLAEEDAEQLLDASNDLIGGLEGS